MNERVILIDGHSMAFRAFYGLPLENFMTSTGQHTNAVHGFTSMLLALLRDRQPTHIAVCFDVSRHSFRTDEYADYKGTRASTPEEFKGQVELIKQVLDALHIVHLEKDHYEADDLIATLASRCSAKGWETLVVSGDRDSFQLINDHTRVLYPVRGVSELADMDAQAVIDKYGVAPERYPEVAALVGETSDNLPGVPGVGVKTAAKWLNAYDGLDNLLLRADQVPGKAGESFRAHIDDVRRNRRLNALVRDVELPVEVDDLARRGFDRDEVHRVFNVLEFKTLRERVLESLDAQASEEPSASEVELQVTHHTDGAVTTWLDDHHEPIGLVTLGVGAPMRLDSIVLATADGHALAIDVTRLTPADETALSTWLADEQAPKVMHAAKAARIAFLEHGWTLAGLTCDTELAAYLLMPDQRSYGLEDLAIRYLNRTISTQAPTDQPMLDLGGDDESATDAGKQASLLVDLAAALMADLEKNGSASLLRDVEIPIQAILARMEADGIAVDAQVLNDLHADFDQRVVETQQRAWEIVGTQVNLSSPKQLQEVLFTQLKLPTTRKIKSGYTTDAEAIEGLYARTEHPFLAELLAYRETIKLRQSVEGLQKTIADDGRIHTTFQQTIAATGRLSSTDPNLQNIPMRTPEGRQIRSAFVAGKGFEALMSADYSQIEMRVMAHLSGDADLIEAFRSGADFHALTAAKVYGIDLAEVTPAQRAGVKQMNYGLAYGLSAYGLSARLGVSVPEAQALMDDYFETFGAVHTYLTEVVNQARRTGYTETLLGRRRYLPNLTSSNRRLREMAERMALNAPIQGSAADIIKIAMITLDRALSAADLRSRILLQIHDELLLEVAPGEREQVEELVTQHMSSAMELAVPLDVSIGYGRTWLEAAH